MTDDTTPQPRALHLLTLESLLSDLLLGRSISITGNQTVKFESEDTRNVLQWYHANSEKWDRNLTAGDTDAIVARIDREIPESLNTAPNLLEHEKKILTLKRVTAHRFAGIHSFGSVGHVPEDFVFEIDKKVTLLEGANGSGKTSVANAIVWCLTGHLIRSQREPEQGPTEFECEISKLDGTSTRHKMSAITPMPHAGCDLPEEGRPITADSWVELIFIDESENELPPIRRSQIRNSRGTISEIAPDLESVGLDPIAWRMATTMPALLPFLSVGSTSQLGHAVARLTGLAALVDLSKHAQKAEVRILGPLTKDHEASRQKNADHYLEVTSDLDRIPIENNDLGLEFIVPKIDGEKAQAEIQELLEYFETVKTQAFQDAKNVLGADFDPEDRPSRQNLEKQIYPALAQIKSYKDLPSMSRLIKMTKVSEEDVAQARILLTKLRTEASTLSSLLLDPALATRAQLYARISDWLHTAHHSIDNNCPVCVQSIEGINDPVSGKPIIIHIEDAADDSEVVSKSVAQWTKHWSGRLSNELHECLTSELRIDLPPTPGHLMRAAFTVELFEADCFKDVLASLSQGMLDLVDLESNKLPSFVALPKFLLPDLGEHQTAELEKLIARSERALIFVEWIRSNTLALRELTLAILKGDEARELDNPAIEAKLTRLLLTVDGVSPLNAAIKYVSRLKHAEKSYRETTKQVELCRRAARACEEIVPLGALAQAQVDELRNLLQDRADYWRKAVYQNATSYAPDLTGTEMDAKGVFGIKVGRLGVEGPAQHLSSASALRGSLLGFFLAFREHVLTLRGGLQLLILDDPQDLLDNDNRIRLARGLTSLAANSAQILATTHDKNFARALVQENRRDDRVRHLSVHPVNLDRPLLTLSPSVEEVDRKKEAFKRNLDNDELAQDYASDLRVYLEARIGDLFDGRMVPAYASPTAAPTLVPLLDKLRSLVATKTGELFTNPIVINFASHPALENSAEPRRILNQSHHDKASLRYEEVASVSDEFNDLRSSIEKVHQQFRLHKWREPLIESVIVDDVLTVLLPMHQPSFSVPLCPDLAAFAADTFSEGSQEEVTETQSDEWFGDKSLFFIRGDTLGFAIPSGSVAIVDSQPYAGSDQNLVISIFGDTVFARRMLKSRDATGISLSAEMPDPRMRRKCSGLQS